MVERLTIESDVDWNIDRRPGQEFDVIAWVENGRALVEATERLSPDVIVSDISMPGLDGIAAAAAILRSNAAARIILVTVHADPLLADRGMAVGAMGFVLKRQAGDELIPAVQSALRGEHFVSRLPPRTVNRKP